MSYTDTNKTVDDPRCLRREAVPASYKTSTGDDPRCSRREAVPTSYKTSSRDDPRCSRREAVPASYKASTGDDPRCLRREAVPASYKTSTGDDPRCLRREAVPASYKTSAMLSTENQSNCNLKRNYYIRILNGLKMCFLIPNIPLTTSWILCTFICNQSWMVSNVQSVNASIIIDKYPWNTTLEYYWILKVWVNLLSPVQI